MSARSRLKRWFSVLWCLAVSAPALAIPLRSGVYVGNGTDLYSYQLPMRRMVRAALSSGELPLWNPHILGGVPLLAGWQLGVLYPPNIAGLLLPTAQWLDLSTGLHVFWLALGGYVLTNAWTSRSWRVWSWGAAISAAILAGSGPTWGHIYPGHTSFLQAWAWAPWIWAGIVACVRDPVVHRASSRPTVTLAGAVAMQLLAGHPQVSYLTIWAGIFVTVAAIVDAPERGRVALLAASRKLVVGGGLGAALAAVQWFPAAWLAPDLNRSLQTTAQIGTAYSAKPAFLWTALTPDAFGSVGARLGGFSYHETLSFVGVTALILLVIAVLRRDGAAWVLGSGIVVAVSFAPGKFGFSLPPLVEIIPGLGAFRVPSRWSVVFVGLCAIAAGRAATWLSEPRRRSGSVQDAREPNRVTVGALAGFALALWVMAALLDEPNNWLEQCFSARGLAASDAVATAVDTTRTTLAVAGLIVAGFSVAVRSDTWRPKAVVGLAFVAAFNAVTMGATHTSDRHFRAAKSVDWSPSVAAKIHQEVKTGRLATASRLRYANWGGAHEVAIAGGYEPAVPLWTNRYANAFAGRSDDRYAVNLQVRTPSARLDRMAVSHLLVDPTDRPTLHRFRAWTTTETLANGMQLRRNPRQISRVHFADDVLVEPDRSAQLRALPNLTDRTTVLSAPLAHRLGGTATITERIFARNRVIVRVQTDREKALILRDAALPGWSATVDGVPAEAAVADGLFRAVAVGAGVHEVVWSYRVPGLLEGFTASIIALLTLIWLARRRSGDVKNGGAAPLDGDDTVRTKTQPDRA